MEMTPEMMEFHTKLETCAKMVEYNSPIRDVLFELEKGFKDMIRDGEYVIRVDGNVSKEDLKKIIEEIAEEKAQNEFKMVICDEESIDKKINKGVFDG